MFFTGLVGLFLLDITLCMWTKGRFLNVYRKLRRVIFIGTLLFALCAFVCLLGYVAIHGKP